MRDNLQKVLGSASTEDPVPTFCWLREVMCAQMRAKHDIYNALYAGCAAGGVLASSGGPKAMCAGCVTFAAFSAFIDRMLDHD